MGDETNRREARRFTMSLPLRVLPGETGGKDLDAETRDVSYRGLYFQTGAKFEIGGEIEFIITLPEQVTQAGDVKIRCRGSIVRVEELGEERLGIAAKIDRYEFVPVNASAN
ncbi:MAG: hypothetical protein NVS9B4_18040 [Candidatus Acidiferrum sp.]